MSPSTPLGPGIPPIVAMLQDPGVHTYESCQGSGGHSFRDPTVRFYGAAGEDWCALSICLNHGVSVRALERVGISTAESHPVRTGSWCCAVSPYRRTARTDGSRQCRQPCCGQGSVGPSDSCRGRDTRPDRTG